MGVRHTIKVGRISGNVEATADMIKRKVALEIYSELLATTPVDTGRARAGWSLGSRHGDNVPPVDESGYGYDVSGVVDPATVPKNAPILYVYNNVEYIGKLNAGSSTQAPREFVQIAIDKVVG